MAIDHLGGQCTCGEKRKEILTFHHSGEKQGNVAKILEYRWSKILEEISRCMLLCRNCHAEIHCKEAWDSRARKLKERLLEIKGVDRCQKCSYRGETVGSLEFHHLGLQKKDFSFGDFTSRNMELTWDVIAIELDKCSVLCSNCHAFEHFDTQRYKSMLEQIDAAMKGYKETRPIDRSIVITMRNSGLTYRQIAEKLSCARSTIFYALKH